MKAAIVEEYGQPIGVVRVMEIEKPRPTGKELLIKVKSASLNDYDWSLVRGKPYLYRLMFGLQKPKHKVLGMELAGVVEEVGAEVKKFKAGDAVFGDISEHGFGSLAEFICIHEDAVITKHPEISFDEAAALPHASTLAMQALRDMGQIKTGMKVLINGAGGGVGTLGLQIAKLYNCKVTGVDSAEKFDMMKDLGFDKMIDYRSENFTKSGLKYDLILDCKSNQSALAYQRVLSPEGRYISIGGKLLSLVNVLFLGKLVSLFSSKRLQVLSLKANKGLEEIGNLVVDQKLRCQIDGPYSIDEVGAYLQYFGEGKHEGKVIINI